MKIASLALALWASASEAEPYVVWYDPGGNLIQREFMIASLWDDQVQIQGLCASACTLYLGLPDVCVSPNSIFVFHGPFYMDQKMSQEDFDKWSSYMAQYYPANVAGWFMIQGRYTETYIMGSKLIEIAAAKAC